MSSCCPDRPQHRPISRRMQRVYWRATSAHCEIIVLDALPAASTGKILKHRLTEVAGDRDI